MASGAGVRTVIGPRRAGKPPRRVELVELDEQEQPSSRPPSSRPVQRLHDSASKISAARQTFPLRGPKTYVESESGLLRQIRPDLTARFHASLPSDRIAAILAAFKLTVRRTNPYFPNHVTAAGAVLERNPDLSFDFAEQLAQHPDVVFASPSFVSQYRRDAAPRDARQWHLFNGANAPGQKAGEDVRVDPAWETTRGDGALVAVVDDGVDVEHVALASRVWRDPEDATRRGRDFFVEDDEAGHYDPRPKVWAYPFDDGDKNDVHGTPCAGLIAADGTNGVSGVAPGCTILPLKVFHASKWAGDERVGLAIQYAGLGAKADVISCSWDSGYTPDVERAIEDVVTLGRGGKGCVVVCSAGNESRGRVAFPANLDGVIAVGASTDQGEHAEYSNRGPELSVVAPSSGGILQVFTTDVSERERGYNLEGDTTDRFGGTSAATAMVAGAAALILAARPELRARDVRDILMETADKIGSLPYVNGKNDAFGAGRINLDRALARVRAF